jgi:predicted RNA-binding protein YlxR (DUF448 family)
MRERMCMVTRKVLPERELIRFALAPDGMVSPDLKCKLPGRGVWIGAHRDLILQAARKNVFSRGFETSVTVPDGLADLIAVLMRKDALSLLSLANRAGLVTTGFEKVSAQLAKRGNPVILAANDASLDGRRKIAARARAAGKEVKTITIFTSDEISLALGQTNVVHAALEDGGLTIRLAGVVEKLETYSGLEIALVADELPRETGKV